MEKDIPRIYFKENKSLGIEVMNFTRLLDKLNQSKNHDPFSVHKIEFFFILIVTNNSYTHFVDFTSYKLAKGSTLFVAKNQVHHFTKSLQKSNGFCIIFDNTFIGQDYFLSGYHKLNRLFNYHIETPVIHQREMGEDNLIDMVTKLHEEYTFSNRFAKTEILRALLHVLLLKAERAKEFHSVSGVKTHWLEVFNQFKSLLETGYANSRNSKFYASKLFVSYKFLNEVVKKLTGKTVKTFIDDFVVIEIKRYLVSTSLSVKEISYRTGFEEPGNLVKFFKKHTKTTPFKFRQQF